MLFLGGTGGGGDYLCCALSWGVQLKYVVCVLAAVLCGSPATPCPYLMSAAEHTNVQPTPNTSQNLNNLWHHMLHMTEDRLKIEIRGKYKKKLDKN